MATEKRVQNNGDTVTWSFKVSNNSSVDCFGTQVAFSLPTGVSLTGTLISGTSAISVPVGSFNPTSNIWFIGDLNANSSTDTANFEFTVDDITQADSEDSFTVTATVTSRCGDSASEDNVLELKIVVGEECVEINLSVGGTIPNSGDSGDLNICV